MGNLTRDNAEIYAAVKLHKQQRKYLQVFLFRCIKLWNKVINFRNKKVKENFFDNGAIIQKIDNVDKQFLWLKKLLESRNRKK